MGFLSDLDLENVDDDPNALPNGTYKCALFECKVVEYKDTSKGKAIVFTYKVQDEAHKGKTIDEWKTANAFDEPAKKGWLKARILSLGVPESRIATLDPEDLVGTMVDVTVKQKGEYRNVTFVKLSDPNAAESVGATASAGVLGDL